MKENRYLLGVLALLLMAFTVNLVLAFPEVTDNTAVAVPSENGTSTLLNVTSRMQQYVGFFGRVWQEVRLNTTVGSGTMYNKSVSSGKMYFFKAGSTPTGVFTPALNNSQTDGNFSLSGFYVTGNHFVLNSTVCGTASVDHLNTTDNYMNGIFKDAAATPNYFLCVDILPKTSTNGFESPDGNVQFEIVVPKTASYLSYDIWIDSS